VAHEVKNPLAAIRGAVQFLREEARRGGVPDSLQSYLELVDDEVERLDAVVTDYHSLARATAVRNQRVDVGKVVRDLVALHGRVVPAGIEVKVEVGEGLPSVRADAGRLRQALLNLVRNAVAAMPKGGTLSLRARCEPGRKADPSILLEVEDTGVGISKVNLAEIFKPLYSTTSGGSGLGLAVTQRIAEEHGGTLLVRSHTGGGSTFILVLPAEAAVEEAGP
jgi:signal transduction histidine kinase